MKLFEILKAGIGNCLKSLCLFYSSEWILPLLLAVIKRKEAFSDGCYTYINSCSCFSPVSLRYMLILAFSVQRTFFLYFQKTNVTLNVSSSATFMKVSLLCTTGDSLLIKEFLSSTPKVTLFFTGSYIH